MASLSDYFYDALQSINDLGYRALNGTPSPTEQAQIAMNNARSVAGAGGGRAAQEQAYNSTLSFFDNYFPARGPLSTLADVLSGNPTGTPGKTDYVRLLIVVALLVLVMWVAVKVAKEVF